MPRVQAQRPVGPSKKRGTKGKQFPHPFLDPLHRLLQSPLHVAAAVMKVLPPVAVAVMVAEVEGGDDGDGKG